MRSANKNSGCYVASETVVVDTSIFDVTEDLYPFTISPTIMTNTTMLLIRSKCLLHLLYAVFWVIPRRLKFICRRFGTLCLFHLHRQVHVECILHAPTCLWRWNRQSVPKRRRINFRRRGITQKKAYNIQYMAKVWNQVYFTCLN